MAKTKIIRKDFNSINHLIQHNKDGQVNKNIWAHGCSSTTGTKSFTMTDSFEDAMDLMLKGWSEGAKKLTSSLNIANSKMQDKEVKRAIHDVVGFQASVPRYLQGIPTNMVNKKSVKQKQKIVTLTKSIAYSAMIKANQILEDSVKFLQIVQAIEKKGMRVNVYVVWHSKKDDEETIFKTKIKSASERLNVSKMSFPLMHPSFLRRIMFRAIEVNHEIKNNWSYGYGQPMHNTQEYLDKNEYFIPVMISDKDALDIIETTK